MLLGNWKFTG